MQLFVRGLKNNETLEVKEDIITIAAVKAQIAQQYGCDAKEIILNCEGVALCNEAVVSSLPSFELDVTVPILGGKVHGSLARAGKVRGQTPKVEKQDNKNKLTGRAKKRSQYNKRLNNNVADFGRGRGPNYNGSF